MNLAQQYEALLALAEADLLLAGGVDSWDGYYAATENVKPTGDSLADTQAWLNALEAGGVDAWPWRSEALASLADYSSYLDVLAHPSLALPVGAWDERRRAATEAALEDSVGEENTPPRAIKAGAEAALMDHLAASYPGTDAEALTLALIEEDQIWSLQTFPAEYALALKEIKRGIPAPLEVAKHKLLSLLLETGKLDELVARRLG